MSHFLDQLPPKHSPWGACQTADEPISGVWHVTTASHGGYIINPERNLQIPEDARNGGGVYEEDNDWAIVGWVFRTELLAKDAAFPIVRAKEILFHWHPDIYQSLTGETPTEDSFTLKRRKSLAEAVGKAVVRSARLPIPGEAPANHVIVTTCVLAGIDLRELPIFDDRSACEWTVPASEYDRRTGYFNPIETFSGAERRPNQQHN